MRRVPKEIGTIRSRYLKKIKFQKPFIKKYGFPVLVHSPHNKKTFLKILKEGKIKLPKKHDSEKMTPYMEELLGIENSIYYSLGFIYSIAYGFKYAFIFDPKYLRELKYYKNSIGYQCYKIIVDIWYEYDRTYFEIVRNKNKETREVFDIYLNRIYQGEKRKIFQFWRIEKEMYDAFMEYRGNKKHIFEIIKQKADELVIKYPKSLRKVEEEWAGKEIPEILGFKDNNLLKNPYFLGFYVGGAVPRDVVKVLKEKFRGKILFDGKKIIEIGELKPSQKK